MKILCNKEPERKSNLPLFTIQHKLASNYTKIQCKHAVIWQMRDGNTFTYCLQSCILKSNRGRKVGELRKIYLYYTISRGNPVYVLLRQYGLSRHDLITARLFSKSHISHMKAVPRNNIVGRN